ncbi:MAG: TolC family protein [Candidatus Omnitrophica bacterium]|nr:TolC family protein [Candidatus Omnitrophota bacterium]MBI3020927.1 TolC family protein [Candidatus Omnitrophota bacterium]
MRLTRFSCSTLNRTVLSLVFLCVVASPLVAAAQEPAAPISPAPSRFDVTADDPPLTLADCFALALARSETIAIQQELIKETEGRFLQALSGVLPRASFALSEKRQDGSGGSAFTLREIPERKFVFSQPLFSGFKEFAAMAGARAERRERKEERARAEGLLLVDAADAFYLLLEHREDLKALEAIRTALVGRIDELKERQRLGRSRPSEVVSAEAQVLRVEAELELARSEETTARQLLEFLTGRAPIGAITDNEPPLLPPGNEDDYVAKAPTRPDVKAAEEAWQAAKNEVTIAQAARWPKVDVESNYYETRAGAASGVDWDVILTVDAPIFQGGQTIGAVREAASRERQAELHFERTQREAELDIRDTCAKLQGAMARHAALQSALAAAEENYRLQVEDYRLSLINNLDVLQTLQALEDARREAVAARYAAKRLHWRLRVAVGETL